MSNTLNHIYHYSENQSPSQAHSNISDHDFLNYHPQPKCIGKSLDGEDNYNYEDLSKEFISNPPIQMHNISDQDSNISSFINTNTPSFPLINLNQNQYQKVRSSDLQVNSNSFYSTNINNQSVLQREFFSKEITDKKLSVSEPNLQSSTLSFFNQKDALESQNRPSLQEKQKISQFCLSLQYYQTTTNLQFLKKQEEAKQIIQRIKESKQYKDTQVNRIKDNFPAYIVRFIFFFIIMIKKKTQKKFIKNYQQQQIEHKKQSIKIQNLSNEKSTQEASIKFNNYSEMMKYEKKIEAKQFQLEMELLYKKISDPKQKRLKLSILNEIIKSYQIVGWFVKYKIRLDVFIVCQFSEIINLNLQKGQQIMTVLLNQIYSLNKNQYQYYHNICQVINKLQLKLIILNDNVKTNISSYIASTSNNLIKVKNQEIIKLIFQLKIRIKHFIIWRLYFDQLNISIGHTYKYCNNRVIESLKIVDIGLQNQKQTKQNQLQKILLLKLKQGFKKNNVLINQDSNQNTQLETYIKQVKKNIVLADQNFEQIRKAQKNQRLTKSKDAQLSQQKKESKSSGLVKLDQKLSIKQLQTLQHENQAFNIQSEYFKQFQLFKELLSNGKLQNQQVQKVQQVLFDIQSQLQSQNKYKNEKHKTIKKQHYTKQKVKNKNLRNKGNERSQTANFFTQSQCLQKQIPIQIIQGKSINCTPFLFDNPNGFQYQNWQVRYANNYIEIQENILDEREENNEYQLIKGMDEQKGEQEIELMKVNYVDEYIQRQFMRLIDEVKSHRQKPNQNNLFQLAVSS